MNLAVKRVIVVEGFGNFHSGRVKERTNRSSKSDSDNGSSKDKDERKVGYDLTSS